MGIENITHHKYAVKNVVLKIKIISSLQFIKVFIILNKDNRKKLTR